MASSTALVSFASGLGAIAIDTGRFSVDVRLERNLAPLTALAEDMSIVEGPAGRPGRDGGRTGGTGEAPFEGDSTDFGIASDSPVKFRFGNGGSSDVVWVWPSLDAVRGRTLVGRSAAALPTLRISPLVSSSCVIVCEPGAAAVTGFVGLGGGTGGPGEMVGGSVRVGWGRQFGWGQAGIGAIIRRPATHCHK